MSWEEKRTWVGLVVGLGAYGVYVAVVLGRADGGALADVAYVRALLWAIGGSIAATIVITIVTGIVSPEGVEQSDARDRQIGRFGEAAGHWRLVAGGLGVLRLALTEASHFWIANVLYLAFVPWAFLEGVVKIAAYRRGFPPW